MKTSLIKSFGMEILHISGKTSGVGCFLLKIFSQMYTKLRLEKFLKFVSMFQVKNLLFVEKIVEER